MLTLEVLPTAIVVLTLIAALTVRFVQFLDRHGVSHWYLVTAIAGVVALGIARSLVRAARRRGQYLEQMLMQQRYPFCHIKRLRNGSWFLTDRATGREYLPPHPEAR
jgi:hypothetical protein